MGWIQACAVAARAAPYEKGTETLMTFQAHVRAILPRARPPMRRGLKQMYCRLGVSAGPAPRARPPMRRGLKLPLGSARSTISAAARAAPYEKGTETPVWWD